MTKNLLDALELPEKTRALHASYAPLCTFGYAVTRAGAARIVTDIAPISRPESIAFDAMLMHGCAARGLRCLTLNPEIFHHMPGNSVIKMEEKPEKVFLPPVDAAGLEQTRVRGETSNVDCGFWSGDFEFEGKGDGDEEEARRLEWLREEVGRKGRCLKPGRDDGSAAIA